MITEQVINTMVGRLVEQFDPLKVVLFGSCARSGLEEGTDVDLLVLMPDGVLTRQTAVEMLRALAGSGAPKDIVVATPALLLRFGDSPGMLYRTALRDGKVLYERSIQ
jgi:predicted nucleotidyltransferase